MIPVAHVVNPGALVAADRLMFGAREVSKFGEVNDPSNVDLYSLAVSSR